MRNEAVRRTEQKSSPFESRRYSTNTPAEAHWIKAEHQRTTRFNDDKKDQTDWTSTHKWSIQRQKPSSEGRSARPVFSTPTLWRCSNWTWSRCSLWFNCTGFDHWTESTDVIRMSLQFACCSVSKQLMGTNTKTQNKEKEQNTWQTNTKEARRWQAARLR